MSVRPCQICRDWRKCAGYPFYSPSEIEAAFCFWQIFWVILHREGLQEGVYPVDPTPTGYVGGNSAGFKSGAKFLKPAEIAAEFDRRHKKTGKAGKVLLHEIQVLGAERPEMLSQVARDALYYVAGKDAKRRNFSQWLADRDYEKRRSRTIKISGNETITIECRS